ncbi:hypothetical protein PoB_003742600 [Plakobranchus ocellatus]|uniref:Uncharacterized protein n=1 Tax=Plakobranchus ocellatus TaxID=259542 RepID=A0AAV4AWM3_9GAST|nr:hypothetical protein PoB_003742600 [Plakobranchus ocellatus]
MAEHDKTALTTYDSVATSPGAASVSERQQAPGDSSTGYQQLKGATPADGVKKPKENELVRFPPCIVHSLYEISAMTTEAETEMAANASRSSVENGDPEHGQYSPQRTPNPQGSPGSGPGPEAQGASDKLWCMSRLSNWISWALERGFFK